MSKNNESDVMQRSAEGTALSEAKYLDTHYQAAKDAYEEMTRFVGFQKGWSILDAGAGGGSFIQLISEMLGVDGKITALDLDAENIAIIERRQAANEFSCPVETTIGGVTDLQFDTNSFDAVWCSNVSQYLSDEDMVSMLGEFKRVVRPEGLIIIKEYDESGSVFGMDLARSRRMSDALTTIPDFAIQAHGFRRIIRIPHLFAQHGIETASYKSFASDFRYPVATNERPFLNSITPNIGWLVSQVNLPEDDKAYWRRWADPAADDYILDSPDYYVREAYGIAIGRKPI